jgi:membrane protein YdbS with pleckstrin-like domain
MSFTNPPIDLAGLPRAETLAWTPMPPGHRREVLVQSALSVGILAVVAFIQGVLIPYPDALTWVFTVLTPVSVLVLGAGITRLLLEKVKMKGYALREHDLAYRSGLVWRKVVVLPFNRIQHVEVSTGPLQRRFGLATLKCFTAGGGTVDLKIEGLLRGEAEKLRKHILNRSALALESD